MRRFFTVKNPTANDKAAVDSFVEGTDLSTTEYMFAKLFDGTPEPAWEGTAVEVFELGEYGPEVQGASQSALYGGPAGPAIVRPPRWQ